MQHLFGQKSDQWAYEKEWRIIGFSESGGGLFPAYFPSIAVIFGARAKRELMMKAWELLKGLGIEFYQATFNAGQMEIGIMRFRPT